MAKIALLERKCSGCGQCRSVCPFGAVDWKDNRPELNAACRVCGLCVKNCPEQALIRLETRESSVEKNKWKGILVFAEVSGGRLHPVGLELIGKALELAEVCHDPVLAVLVGSGVRDYAEELRHWGVSQVYVYDDPARPGSGRTRTQPAWKNVSGTRAPALCWWAPQASAVPWRRGCPPGSIPG